MSRLYNKAYENHCTIFLCFGTLDEGQNWILLVSFKVFEDLKLDVLFDHEWASFDRYWPRTIHDFTTDWYSMNFMYLNLNNWKPRGKNLGILKKSAFVD